MCKTRSEESDQVPVRDMGDRATTNVQWRIQRTQSGQSEMACTSSRAPSQATQAVDGDGGGYREKAWALGALACVCVLSVLAQL